MKIAIEIEPVTCCPGSCGDGCADCEQPWGEMVRPSGAVNGTTEEVRMCLCGTFWTPRICPSCYRMERRRKRAEEAPDAFREKSKERKIEGGGR